MDIPPEAELEKTPAENVKVGCVRVCVCVLCDGVVRALWWGCSGACVLVCGGDCPCRIRRSLPVGISP